jgi:uncharacterized membrane protein
MEVAAPEPTTARLEGLSDGIIAIAATLLVIELAVPAAGEDVGHALREELPAIAAFAVSFLTILIFWVNHHALFRAVARPDRGVQFLNGLLLLGISFLSYPTAVLGRTLQAGPYERSGAVFYALVLAGTSGLFAGLWVYLAARPQLLAPWARPGAAAAVRRSLVGPGLYLLAALVALADAPVALAVVALVALYFALPPHILSRRSA